MNSKYKIWIDNYLLENKIIAGRCYPACLAMQEVFPELELQKGYIIDLSQGKRMHWWLELAGEIIDPTASQFNNLIEYQKYNLINHGPLPVGKCINCAELYYLDNFAPCCSSNCSKETVDYLNNKNICL